MIINPNCPICRKLISPKGYIKKSDFLAPEDYKNLTESSKMTAILTKM